MIEAFKTRMSIAKCNNKHRIKKEFKQQKNSMETCNNAIYQN